MKITFDDSGKGVIRLVSSEVLTDETKRKIEKRIENKKAILKKMKEDLQSGVFDSVIATL
jgi:hypothetical protein